MKNNKKPKPNEPKKFWPGEPQNPFKQNQGFKHSQVQQRMPMGRKSSRGR